MTLSQIIRTILLFAALPLLPSALDAQTNPKVCQKAKPEVRIDVLTGRTRETTTVTCLVIPPCQPDAEPKTSKPSKKKTKAKRH